MQTIFSRFPRMNIIKRVRKQYDLTQRELAELLQRDRQALAKLEGKNNNELPVVVYQLMEYVSRFGVQPLRELKIKEIKGE